MDEESLQVTLSRESEAQMQHLMAGTGLFK